jgi:L-aminopeptidase/D-esterase-like protein
MDSEPSLREHGLRIGELRPGPTGSIADVDGVAVGHVTGRTRRRGAASPAAA